MVIVRFQLLLCGALLAVLTGVPAYCEDLHPAMNDPVSPQRVLLPIEQDGQWGYVTPDGQTGSITMTNSLAWSADGPD